MSFSDFRFRPMTFSDFELNTDYSDFARNDVDEITLDCNRCGWFKAFSVSGVPLNSVTDASAEHAAECPAHD